VEEEVVMLTQLVLVVVELEVIENLQVLHQVVTQLVL
jgi:hypothetical protein